jgi:hypothetical protein
MKTALTILNKRLRKRCTFALDPTKDSPYLRDILDCGYTNPISDLAIAVRDIILVEREACSKTEFL